MPKTELCNIFILAFMCYLPLMGSVTYDNNPGAVSISEDDDSRVDLWTISATCTYTNNSMVEITEPCTDCSISTNPDANLFFISGLTVSKYSCSTTGCGICFGCGSCGTGCLDYNSQPTSYDIEVTCQTTGNHVDDFGSATLTVSIVQNPVPTINLDVTVSASRTNSQNDVIFTTVVGADPSGETIEYTLSSGVNDSYEIGTTDLFQLNNVTGEVYINADPSEEFSQTMSMEICANDRRNQVCGTLTIEFNGRFQRPTCADQGPITVTDTHPIGDELFTVTVSSPTDQFSGQDFTGLLFSIDSSTLDVATIDVIGVGGIAAGQITTSGNITIHPKMSEDYSIVVEVSNTDSCSHTSTCTMSLTATFTNCPIRIDNLPANKELLEDEDSRMLLLNINTYDCNSPDEDNVTCTINNPDSTLIEFTDDGNNAYNSFSIYKKACLDAGCGPVCSSGRGCMNYDETNQYLIEVTCSDAYGSSDTATLTFDVTENDASVLTNLPGLAAANNSMRQGDVIFETLFTNNPSGEDIQYSVSSGVADSYNIGTDDLFVLDISTGEVYINADPSLEFTQTMYMTICVSDRRNTVCGQLTIEFSGCFQTPTCTNQTDNSLVDTHGIGDQLFQVVVPNPTDQFTGELFAGLTFSIDSSTLDVASLNSTAGDITTTGNITVHPSYPSQDYEIIVRVSNTDSCTHTSTCAMSMAVTFTNWPIRIDNLPTTVTLLEDVDTREPLLQLYTHDLNPAGHDNVTCVMTSNPDPTLIEFVDDGNFNYDSYSIYKKQCNDSGCGPLCAADIGCMNYHINSSYLIELQCSDGYGSTDTATLTFQVEENTPPVLNNLPGTATANNTMSEGDVIFSVSFSNYPADEAFEYVLTSGVDNSYVLGTVALFDFDNATGEVYINSDPSLEFTQIMYMTICVSERRNEVCGNLTIEFRGCFQTPTCTNQTDNSFVDTHGIGDQLFQVVVPNPTDQFSGEPFAGLTFSIDSSTLDVASINGTEGDITTTGNITVHPSYPSQDYEIIVRVSNTDSCTHTSTCTMSMTVNFTNWPIRIDNLPHTVTVLEDVDTREPLLQLYTHDLNPADHDNVTCAMTSNPDPTLIEFVDDGNFNYDSYSIYKKQCNDSGCGPLCDADIGCMNYHINSSYLIEVQCSDGYGSKDTATLTFQVEENTPPVLNNLPGTATANNSMNEGVVIFSVSFSNHPADESFEYILSSGVENSYFIGTVALFDFNNATGEVYINSDPSLEFTQTMYMTICVSERRNEVCGNLTIEFGGCFQKPTCDDQSDHNVIDTHNIGDELFTMSVPDPTDHFTGQIFSGLSFLVHTTTLGVVTINSTSGVLYTTGNITVHPSYPDQDYSVVIRVANAESCTHYSYCTMSLTVAFTNWPIRIDNSEVDRAVRVHEDTDSRTRLFQIYAYDFNPSTQDNVTCDIVNPDNTLIELVHDGSYEPDAYTIWKKVCNDLLCGPVCPTGIGCLNHDLRDEYIIEVTCWDAYGTSDTKNFTVTVVDNDPPQWVNMPATIYIDIRNVAQYDMIYSFIYTDTESETLDYNYTITPDQPAGDNAIFTWDMRGNYFGDYPLDNNSILEITPVWNCYPKGSHTTGATKRSIIAYDDELANVTALKHMHELSTETYSLYVCGTERRNTVCETLTIVLQDLCGPTPSCTPQSVTVTDQFGVGGDLFTVTVNPPAFGSYTQITYAIASSQSGYFKINETSGTVVTESNLEAESPSYDYYIRAYVYDSEACSYGYCLLTVTVNFTNFDIFITNMDNVSVDIHEDTTDETTLIVIATSDANTGDSVSCEVDEANSVPSNNGRFAVEKTYPGSEVYMVLSKPSTLGFDYDDVSEYTVRVICRDRYGSTDTKSITVFILENQIPTLSNLATPTTISIDLTTTFSGSTIYTVEAVDAADEDDNLIFNCTVDSYWVPLQCTNDGDVFMRRNVTWPEENSESFNITVCVNDETHSHRVCGELIVIFAAVNDDPVLKNLPATVDFDEMIASGTILFNITVEDSDVGDNHTFSVKVEPDTATHMFNLDTNTGVISLANGYTFDYETVSSFYLTVSVKDKHLPGILPQVLTININDVNEDPRLKLETTQLTTQEGNASKELGDINYSCTDPDIGQNLTLSITSGTHMTYFSFSSQSDSLSTISYALDWDLENGTLPTNTTLTLTCDDGNGLFDSATIDIFIEAVNEFPPDLDTSSAELEINASTSVIDILLTVAATDRDYGDDGIFYFNVLGVGKGFKYFVMSTNGELKLKDYIEWNYNYTFSFTIEVTDEEKSGDYLTSYVDVIVHYVAAPPEDPEIITYCLTCTTAGIVIVAVLGLEACFLIGMIVHITVRCRAWELCTGRSRAIYDTDVGDLDGIDESDSIHKQEISERTRSQADYTPFERPGSEFDTRYLPAEPPPGPAIYDPPPPPPPAVYSKDSVIDADTLPELSTVPDGYKSNQPYIINTTHNTRPISELNRTISNEHHNETLLNQHISGKHFQKPVTTFSSPIFAPKPQPVVDWSGDYGVSDITTSHTVINERAVISSSSILVHDPPSPSLFNRSHRLRQPQRTANLDF